MFYASKHIVPADGTVNCCTVLNNVTLSPDHLFSCVRAHQRLLCVRKRILVISVYYMYAVLSVKTSVAIGHDSYRRYYRCLRHGGLLRILDVHELRREDGHLHPPRVTSSDSPSGIQKHHNRLADSNPGKKYYQPSKTKR